MFGWQEILACSGGSYDSEQWRELVGFGARRGPLQFPSPSRETEAPSGEVTSLGSHRVAGSPCIAHGALPFTLWPLVPVKQSAVPLRYYFLPSGKWDSDPCEMRMFQEL